MLTGTVGPSLALRQPTETGSSGVRNCLYFHKEPFSPFASLFL